MNRSCSSCGGGLRWRTASWASIGPRGRDEGGPRMPVRCMAGRAPAHAGGPAAGNAVRRSARLPHRRGCGLRDFHGGQNRSPRGSVGGATLSSGTGSSSGRPPSRTTRVCGRPGMAPPGVGGRLRDAVHAPGAELGGGAGPAGAAMITAPRAHAATAGSPLDWGYGATSLKVARQGQRCW